MARGAVRRPPMNLHLKKGALTRTVKRTGKSWGELAHSRNPKTRKRAILAMTMKKWHHGRRRKAT